MRPLLWLPKWLRSESKPTDAELESADRRLFLRGLTLTSAGLVVGVPLISVPKPMPWSRIVTGMDLSYLPSKSITFLVVDASSMYERNRINSAFGADVRVVESIQDAYAQLRKQGNGEAVKIYVKPTK